MFTHVQEHKLSYLHFKSITAWSEVATSAHSSKVTLCLVRPQLKELSALSGTTYELMPTALDSKSSLPDWYEIRTHAYIPAYFFRSLMEKLIWRH